MMMDKAMRILSVAAVVTTLSGCWSFSQSQYPQTQIMHTPAGKDYTVAVLGFDAMVTEYVTAQGFQTVYVPGGCGYYWHSGFYEVVPTQTTWAQARPTDMFLKRAKDTFEKGGFIIGAPQPDWSVDVDFKGPFVDGGDRALEFAWVICTIGFCDYMAQSWSATLKIRDNKTGKLVFSNDYVQRFETKAAGIIPFFGIASCNENSAAFSQGWCLAALTDRVVADASQFILSNAR